MQRASSILLLILFCVYSFTFKTHYCYYAGTNTRFHGDCEHEIKEAASKGELAHTNFFPKHYFCKDIVKNAIPEQSKVAVIKNFTSDIFALSFPGGIIVPHFSFLEWNIPEVRCRSATLSLSNSLRAPPSC